MSSEKVPLNKSFGENLPSTPKIRNNLQCTLCTSTFSLMKNIIKDYEGNHFLSVKNYTDDSCTIRPGTCIDKQIW